MAFDSYRAPVFQNNVTSVELSTPNVQLSTPNINFSDYYKNLGARYETLSKIDHNTTTEYAPVFVPPKPTEIFFPKVESPTDIFFPNGGYPTAGGSGYPATGGGYPVGYPATGGSGYPTSRPTQPTSKPGQPTTRPGQPGQPGQPMIYEDEVITDKSSFGNFILYAILFFIFILLGFALYKYMKDQNKMTGTFSTRR